MSNRNPKVGQRKHRWLATEILYELEQLRRLQTRILRELSENPRNTGEILKLFAEQTTYLSNAIVKQKDVVSLIDAAPDENDGNTGAVLNDMQAQIDDLRKQVETLMNGHFAELLRDG